MPFFGQEHLHHTAGDGKVFFLIFAKFQLNLRFDWQHDSGGCCAGIREILKRFSEDSSTFGNMNIVLYPSHQILLFSMEEQIRAIIALPVLWSRHVRHLDSGLCSNAHAAPPSMPSQQSHIAPPCKLCKIIFSFSCNLKTHTRANHICDWDPGLSNNVTLNTMNTTQISEMETRCKKSQSERKICVNPPLQFFMSVFLQRMSLCLFSQSLLCFSEPHTPFYIGGFSLFLCSPTIGHVLALYYTTVCTIFCYVKIYTTPWLISNIAT